MEAPVQYPLLDTCLMVTCGELSVWNVCACEQAAVIEGCGAGVLLSDVRPAGLGAGLEIVIVLGWPLSSGRKIPKTLLDDAHGLPAHSPAHGVMLGSFATG